MSGMLSECLHRVSTIHILLILLLLYQIMKWNENEFRLIDFPAEWPRSVSFLVYSISLEFGLTGDILFVIEPKRLW